MDRTKAIEVLGVTDSASSDEVKGAYRRMAKLFHPDKNDSPDAKDKFNEIHEAMQTLLRENNNDEEEEFVFSYDPNEVLITIISEYLHQMFFLRLYRCSTVLQHRYSSNYETRCQNFEENDSDVEDYETFLNFLKKKTANDTTNDKPLFEEAKSFNTFEDWQKAEKVKIKQKLKEAAPVRPKQLKKKQQEHLDYQRDRESEKIRKELMERMEQVRAKEERRLQREEEKRCELQHETRRNLEDTLSRQDPSITFGKGFAPKTSATIRKTSVKHKPKKKNIEKRKVSLSSGKTEDRKESFASFPENGQTRKENECWDSTKSDPFINSLPTCEELKAIQKKQLEEVLRRVRPMVNSLDETKLHEEKGTVSPTFLDRDDSPFETRAFKPIVEELTIEEKERRRRIKKMRELEKKMNEQDLLEIKALESHQRRKAAMEKREMEMSHPKTKARSQSWQRNDATNWDCGSKCNSDLPSNNRQHWGSEDAWDGKDSICSEQVLGKTKESLPWGRVQPEVKTPTGNVWLDRMLAPRRQNELMPQTQNEEETMLQQAIQMSKLQYITDEKNRYERILKFQEQPLPMEKEFRKSKEEFLSQSPSDSNDLVMSDSSDSVNNLLGVVKENQTASRQDNSSCMLSDYGEKESNSSSGKLSPLNTTVKLDSAANSVSHLLPINIIPNSLKMPDVSCEISKNDEKIVNFPLPRELLVSVVDTDKVQNSSTEEFFGKKRLQYQNECQISHCPEIMNREVNCLQRMDSSSSESPMSSGFLSCDDDTSGSGRPVSDNSMKGSPMPEKPSDMSADVAAPSHEAQTPCFQSTILPHVFPSPPEYSDARQTYFARPELLPNPWNVHVPSTLPLIPGYGEISCRAPNGLPPYYDTTQYPSADSAPVLDTFIPLLPSGRCRFPANSGLLKCVRPPHPGPAYLGASDWSNSSLPPSYRYLLESPATTAYVPSFPSSRTLAAIPSRKEFLASADTCSLSSTGRGSHSATSAPMKACGDCSTLDSPPKDVRLRKRWEKQMEALTAFKN